MYSVSAYGSMISDRVRMDAYVRALRQAVKPDSVVLDIGTGTGIFAMLACQFGARRVYAIEPDDVIELAREAAGANGFSDRIEFIQDLSTRATLPERADVIISDIRGILPLFQHHLPSIIDARKRFLAPGGILIPQRDTLWAAVVEAPELYKNVASPWDDNIYDLNLLSARRLAINTWRKGGIKPEQVLAEPNCWATLDYAGLDGPDLNARISWTVLREATAHGIGVWFDATLIEGVSFSNSPGAPELIYGQAFFPFFKPVDLTPDDSICVTVNANLVGEDYVWRWSTVTAGHSKTTKDCFDQSTFFGSPLSPMRLRKRASDFIPSLNEQGQIDRFILSLMDQRLSLEEIANRVLSQFPEHFASWKDALTRAGELSLKYSR
jgi:protein arginine N-methyltransferase 1